MRSESDQSYAASSRASSSADDEGGSVRKSPCGRWYLRRPNVLASAPKMILLKKIGRKFVLGQSASSGRKSLYDFAVASLAVWLLGGFVVMVAWGPSEAEQVPEPLMDNVRSAQTLHQLEKELQNAEEAYQLAVAELNDVAVEHALHRQAVVTFLARHFRDLVADVVGRGQRSTVGATKVNARWLELNRAATALASERRTMLQRVSPANPRVVELEARLFEARTALEATPREVQYDRALKRQLHSDNEVAKQSAVGWEPNWRPNYFVTTEGPSAIYELPALVPVSRESKSSLNEQQRYHQLESAAQSSADQLERVVVAERTAWARMQEAISHYHAVLDFSGVECQTHDDAEPVPTPPGPTASRPALPVGLAVVTVLAPVTGFVFVRKAAPLGRTEPRIFSRPSDVTFELRLPVLGTLRAPSALVADSKRRLAARMQLYNRVDHGRFASEAIVAGALLLWAMLALLQPGFAERFFDQPADAVSEVTSRL
jgi:hypothetical protein